MYEEIIASMKVRRGTILYGGVDQLTIDNYAAKLSWDFDECTRQWFMQCGRGGRTEMGNVMGMGHGCNEVSLSDLISRGLEIASDGCGNYYVVRDVGGRHCVFFVDSISNDDFDQYPPTMYATSVYHFWLIYSRVLQRSKSRVWYNSKHILLSLDPDLEKYTDYIRPWEED